MVLSYYVMRRVGGSVINLLNMLNGLDIEIVPFDMDLALIAAKNALIKHDLSNHAVDYAIGAYAHKCKIPFIANNKKHCQWLGEVYIPAEVMQKYDPGLNKA